jgi:hypothetical protein
MYNKYQKIYDAIAQGKTLLGVGPMSQNCIQAVSNVAFKHLIPILLIASRRQVEDLDLGGGYVTTTQQLGDEISEMNAWHGQQYIYLARDHGGPWQGSDEENMSHEEALERSMQSYFADIECGFDIIHLDPSLKSRPYEQVIKDVDHLYHTCEAFSKYCANRDIIYEVGTEEHGGHITTTDKFEVFVKDVKSLSKVKFVVGNMGLYVKEVENIGKFNEVQAAELVKICNDNSVYLKGHNVDYVPFQVLKTKNSLGVHSINVAPEFGVEETRFILDNVTLEEKNKFLEIAYNSGKWQKWMKDKNTPHSKEYLATICGHYVFTHPEVRKILNAQPVSFYERCQDHLESRIKDYLHYLGWHV